MISAKKLIKLARKWQKLAALKRKRITFPNTITPADRSNSSRSAKYEKGHFAVYSIDEKRFVLPLEYLNNDIIRELLDMAKDEFGLPGSGPLRLPCKAEIIEYAIGLIKHRVGRDVERAFLISVPSSGCSLADVYRIDLFIKFINLQKFLILAESLPLISTHLANFLLITSSVASTHTNSCSTSGKSEKGHFVVYSKDKKRFSLPLEYLNNEVIRELFDMAEEEFGLPGSGPLTLPCDSEIMEYAIALIKQKANRDVERALLTSISNTCASLPFHVQHHVASRQVPICSF